MKTCVDCTYRKQTISCNVCVNTELSGKTYIYPPSDGCDYWKYKPSFFEKLLNLLPYWLILKLVKKCPYFIRIGFWTSLYYYNKNKWPESEFTIEQYKEYAK